MWLDLTDEKPTLVQVMAWCRQATSHCLNQCWPKSMSPHGVTRPQWVKQQKGSCFQVYISITTHPGPEISDGLELQYLHGISIEIRGLMTQLYNNSTLHLAWKEGISNTWSHTLTHQCLKFVNVYNFDVTHFEARKHAEHYQQLVKPRSLIMSVSSRFDVNPINVFIWKYAGTTSQL